MFRYWFVRDVYYSHDYSILFNELDWIAIHAANIPIPKNVCVLVSVFFPRRSFRRLPEPHEPERQCAPAQSYRKTTQCLCPTEVASACFGTGWLL